MLNPIQNYQVIEDCPVIKNAYMGVLYNEDFRGSQIVLKKRLGHP